MRFFSNVCRIGNDICVREYTETGPQKYKVRYKPTLYMTSDTEYGFHTLFGEPVKPVDLDSMSAAKEFVAKFADVSGINIYGQTDYVLAFLNETYPGKIKFDASLMSIWALDIETRLPVDENGTITGFPSAEKADAEIVLITLINMLSKQAFTFGVKAFDGRRAKTKYSEYSSEASMLRGFIDFWNQRNIDIVTGWNIEIFDIPFIANRIKRVLGEDFMKRLSPWNSVDVTTKTIMGKSRVVVDIAGITVLDYLDLYKKFTYVRQESYSLGAIASYELGTTKLDHSEYKNFNDFIDRGWNEKFVEYNVIDTMLVCQLDDKLGLIDIALNLAYLAKININNVFGPVKTWDAIIHNSLLAEGKVVPMKEHIVGSDGIEGAYVKQPTAGFKRWVVTVDAESLYPSNAIMLNMSPETYLGRDDSVTLDFMLNGAVTAEGKDYCMSPIGAMFSNKEQGIIPRLFEELKAERKLVKREMLTLKQEKEDLVQKYASNPEKLASESKRLEAAIAAKDNMQMAIKIALNSAYGAIANRGFRYYNPNIAESITILGQYSLKLVESKINQRLSGLFKLPPTEFAIYFDTDSIFFEMGPVVDKYMKGKSEQEIVKSLEKIAVDILQTEVDKLMDEIATATNAFKKTLFFKLENVGSKALFVSKKKYIIRVNSSEGVTYAKPKYKIMGMDIVKSSTPHFVRDKLRDSVDLIFDKTESDVHKYVAEVKFEFDKLDTTQIAIPRGVNKLEDYEDSVTIYKQDVAVPINVRAALLYNAQVKKHGLVGVYPLISSGSKIKYFYMKTPNTIRENVFAVPADEKLPDEFDLEKYVDRELQFEKTFLSSLQIMLNAIGWNATEQSSVDSLFE